MPNLKTNHQIRVEKFMELAGQHSVEDPWNPPIELLKLRARLILEEALETVFAMGMMVRVEEFGDDFGPFYISKRWLEQENASLEIQEDEGPNKSKFDLIEVIDGCCDISVVTTGTMVALGLPMEPFLEAIDQNNLEKFTMPGGYRDAGGKWIKPPGHKKPDLKAILDKVLTVESVAEPIPE